MDANVTQFIEGKRIGLVGASRAGKKFGNIAAKELQERGYQVFLVHPEAAEIEGQKCYPDLSSLTGKIDGLVVSVPPSKAAPVLAEAASLGIRNVWLQQGAETPDLVRQGEDLKLNLVSGKCILMYARPVRSFHKFHALVMKVFGKY